MTGMAQKRKWSEMSPGARAGIVAGAAVEIVLTTIALRDLAKRPAALVRGPKALWALGCVIQPVGPVLYLTAGRRR